MSFRVLVILILVSTAALGSEVILTENGDIRGSATDIDRFLTLPPPAVVFSTPPFPTATVTGKLDTNVDVDWVTFTGRGGQQVYVDSDHVPLQVDTAVHLFSADGTLLATADDSLPVDLGSELDLDAFLGVFILPADGRYFLAISSWSRIPATSASASIELFRPDGGEGGFAVVGAQAGNDSFTGLVDPIDLGEYTVHVTVGGGICSVTPTYDAGTLSLHFELATPAPVTWSLWILTGPSAQRRWSVNIKELEKKTVFTVPIANFPSIGSFGVLSTFNNTSGIVCSDWETLDTRASTTAPALARAPRPPKRSRQ